jgi:hypothetical protein
VALLDELLAAQLLDVIGGLAWAVCVFRLTAALADLRGRSEALKSGRRGGQRDHASITVRMRAWWYWMAPTRVAPTTVARGKFSNRFSPMKQASMQYAC